MSDIIEIVEWAALILVGAVVYNLIPFVIVLYGCKRAKTGKSWIWCFVIAFLVQACAFTGGIMFVIKNSISTSARIQMVTEIVFFVAMYVSMLAYAKRNERKPLVESSSETVLQNERNKPSNISKIKSASSAGVSSALPAVFTANILDPMGSLISPEGIWRKETITPKTEEERRFYLSHVDTETGELFFLITYREGKAEQYICNKDVFISALDATASIFESDIASTNEETTSSKGISNTDNEQVSTIMNSKNNTNASGAKRMGVEKSNDMSNSNTTFVANEDAINATPHKKEPGDLSEVSKSEVYMKPMDKHVDKKKDIDPNSNAPIKQSFEKDIEVLRIFKTMLDEKLITQADYDEKKAEVIKKIVG